MNGSTPAAVHADAGLTPPPPCRVCGSIRVAGRHTALEMMNGTREPFAYFQCADCGCLQIERIPADLARHYAGGYYSYTPPQRPANPLRRWAVHARHRWALHGRDPFGWLMYRRAAAYAMRSLRPLELRPDTRLLDVGCGAGLLIFELAELGYRSVLGIDPFIEADRAYDNGARVLKRGLDEASGCWDAVMFHHSFEHVPDPLATLRRTHALLATGGRCLLRVPTVSSYAWQHYGVDWVQLDAPRHLYLFSRESITHLAAATGFDVIDVAFDSDAFQFWGSEQYRRGIALRDERSHAVNPAAGLFSAAQLADWARRAEELNQAGQGDQAAFVLRKRP
ncbi:MAG: class I SAM-dependent methyltransferase [Rubrivivax sp.]|nr:class I SAM-dependent methyltransferase [Rubrivivax sp.]